MNPRMAFLVWHRNLEVYLRTWFLNFLPPFLEPLLYIAGVGMGVGALVGDVPVGGPGGMQISYARFIAPGMVAVAVMQQAFFECSFGSFIRMYYQKTFDALLATPCTLEDVAAGEIAWGATKALISAAPIPDPKVEATRERIILVGDIPRPLRPPPGCNFHTRCPIAIQSCREKEPPQAQKSTDHWVACWRT